MLFYSDEAGSKIAKDFAAKAKEGVTVRVLSDSEMNQKVEEKDLISTF